MSSAVKSVTSGFSGVTDTIFGHEDDSSQKAQIAQNAAAKDLIERNSIQARKDALDLFPTSDINRNLGLQAAFNIMGGTIPQQFDTIRQGNVGAQQALLAGLPQIQNAIMGKKVDLSGLMPQSIDVDTSFAQQQVPAFRMSAATQESEANRKVADIERQNKANQLSGITNDADLFRAAISGDITGLSNSDRNFWKAHLRNVGDDAGSQFVSNPGGRGFIGKDGGFNSANEQKLARLLTQYQAQRAV